MPFFKDFFRDPFLEYREIFNKTALRTGYEDALNVARTRVVAANDMVGACATVFAPSPQQDYYIKGFRQGLHDLGLLQDTMTPAQVEFWKNEYVLEALRGRLLNGMSLQTALKTDGTRLPTEW